MNERDGIRGVVDVEAIPAELRVLSQWLAWRAEQRGVGTKPTKVPINPRSGRRASTTNPATWGTFDEALACWQRSDADGVGFVFTSDDPYVGIDLDGCYDSESGGIEPWAQEIVVALASYTEVSPSGSGLHTIVRGSLPLGRRRKGKLEMYSEGRYFTVTGQLFDGSPAAIAERTDELADLHARLLDDGAPGSDKDLVRRAAQAANGAKFQALWAGDTSGYPSASEADLALCSMLAFWTHNSAARIDALFRQSGLMRDKWDERHGEHTYGQRTIERALSGSGQIVDSDAHGRPEESVDLRPYPLTDAGNAELFTALYGDRLRYDHRCGRWLLWEGHRWAPDVDGEVYRVAVEAARARYHAVVDLENGADRARAAKWAIASESRHRLEACLALARNIHPIADAGDGWDADPWLVGVRNGVIDLRSGELRPGRQDDRITMQIPILFDPEAPCPRWERFLREVFEQDEELIAFLHRAIGYCLTAFVTEQVLFLCHGLGANGKSVFLNVLRLALGDYAVNVAFSVLELSQRSGIPNDVAHLVGRRLVTSSETNEASRLNEARVKMLTGGDPVTARFLYGEPFTFDPSAKLWLAVNYLPAVVDDSHGFWRRVRVIPFRRRFGAGEADLHLLEELKAELPGVLAWAVRGCLAWQEHGLEPPESVASATDAYRADMDDFTRFLDERCVQRPSAMATPTELHQEYLRWASREGIPQKERFSMKAFGQRLKARFEQGKSGGERVYRGVGLATGEEDR